MIVGWEGIGERELADGGNHCGVDIVRDESAGEGERSCELLGCRFERIEGLYIEEEVDVRPELQAEPLWGKVGFSGRWQIDEKSYQKKSENQGVDHLDAPARNILGSQFQ